MLRSRTRATPYNGGALNVHASWESLIIRSECARCHCSGVPSSAPPSTASESKDTDTRSNHKKIRLSSLLQCKGCNGTFIYPSAILVNLVSHSKHTHTHTHTLPVQLIWSTATHLVRIAHCQLLPYAILVFFRVTRTHPIHKLYRLYGIYRL